MSGPLVCARGLRMAFGGTEVVKGVDIDLLPGEVHAIMGENGAGKSTVAKMIAGVYLPTSGSVEAFGQPAHFANPRQALERGVALIHQEPLTFPDLTVAENVFVGHQPLKGRRVDWAAMHGRAEVLLKSLGAKFSSRALAGGLSVADQQTIELAAALAHDARVLLMDETTASLTPKEVEELFETVRRLRDEARALAFVSHRLGEIFAISDRITVMRDGEKVAELRTSETDPAELVRLMVGREVASSRHPVRRPTAEPILRVKALTKRGQFENVNLEVRPGEIVGLAGLVGAGRTEVCEAIFGVARPDAGTVEVSGEAVSLKSPREAVAKGLAMVPEDRQHHGLLLPMSIAANATLSSLRGLWLAPKKDGAMATPFVERLRTVCRTVEQPVQELSGGNQQKVVLAKWLMTGPKVLILDEPTRGVDVGAKEEVHRAIRELVEAGLAILLVSSDLNEVLELSDRVLVMREGRLVGEFDGDAATPERVMGAATGAHATE
ncbi:sugar ABC transporter ATP-binding protein [soil metagenome]